VLRGICAAIAESCYRLAFSSRPVADDNTWALSNWSIGKREREKRNPLHSQSKAGHWSHLRMRALQRFVDGHDIDGTGTTVDCR
jgi:hypothetical protein